MGGGLGGDCGSRWFGFWIGGVWAVRWGMREGMGDRAAISETYLLDALQNGEHEGRDDGKRVVDDGGGRASLLSSHPRC